MHAHTHTQTHTHKVKAILSRISASGTSRKKLDDLIPNNIRFKKLGYQSASLVPNGANLSKEDMSVHSNQR